MKYAGIILGLALIGCLVALSAWRCCERVPEKSDRTTSFGRVIAEGVKVGRHGCYGIDFIRCGSCRVEKRKIGPLTLGGFNVLVLEDLSLVIPPADAASGERRSASGTRNGALAAKDIAASLGISSERFIEMRGGNLKFSGLKVTNLEVSTLSVATNVCPRFAAAFGEAQKDGLHLSGCVITENGASNAVGNAVLRVKPRLCLAWAGGELYM